MWAMDDSVRQLTVDESRLIRGVLGIMVDHSVAELKDDDFQIEYGIDWFDQWDTGQRLWLLDEVGTSLLTQHPPPVAAAMLEAAVDAIFCELFGLIEMELESSSPVDVCQSWRCLTTRVWAARPSSRSLDVADERLQTWQRVVSALSQRFNVTRSYVKADSLRDGPPERLERFLRDRGLPADFLSRIPPLRTWDQIQESIDRLQSYVFR